MPSADVRAWAREEFGSAVLGSKRRTDRLVAMAATAAAGPNGRIAGVFFEGASREGAFRFVENASVRPRAIVEAAVRACVGRASAYSYVYVPVDGTSLNIVDWQRGKGMGVVGARFVGATGLQVMSSIVVAPDGTPLGLGDLRYWARRGRVRRRGRHDRRQVRSKETVYWLDTLRSIQRDFDAHAAECTPWFQLDRGADAWPVLEMCADRGMRVTVRGGRNRCLWNGGRKPDRYLRDVLVATTVRATKSLVVPARNGHPPRVAELSIRYREVVLDLHKSDGKRRRPARYWAVLITETGKPAHGCERIEWLLLTTHPVESLDDAELVVDGYAARWTIEEFHRTWKSGACSVESTQLRAHDHIERWATILAAVATRIMRLTKLARTEPELPATVELSQAEIDAIIVTKKKTKYERGQVPTIAEAVTWLAEIGGYTGKSSGGPPGAQVISRGLLRLQALVAYFGGEEK